MKTGDVVVDQRGPVYIVLQRGESERKDIEGIVSSSFALASRDPPETHFKLEGVGEKYILEGVAARLDKGERVRVGYFRRHQDLVAFYPETLAIRLMGDASVNRVRVCEIIDEKGEVKSAYFGKLGTRLRQPFYVDIEKSAPGGI